jgi:hypothetical protein
MNRRELLMAGTAACGLAGLPSTAKPQAVTKPQARYQLGIVTYNIAAQWDIPTILKICKTVGLNAVELRTTHKHGVEPTLSKAQRADVRKQFADANITLWGVGTVCEFHATDFKVVAQNIETCKQFAQLSAEKTLEQIGKSLIPCGQAAAELNQEIWVEVHGGGTAHPPHVRTIMEHCGLKNVGITWNSNATDVKDGSITPYFELLRPWLKSCHINELHSNYPWRELFTRLRETGYDRVTLAEIAGAPDAASGERLMRYYKALWTELTASRS